MPTVRSSSTPVGRPVAFLRAISRSKELTTTRNWLDLNDNAVVVSPVPSMWAGRRVQTNQQAEVTRLWRWGETGGGGALPMFARGVTGKSQLAEAMLFTAGATTRLGRTDDGSAVMDFEPEELQHGITISTSFHHLNWKRTEVILGNTPGYGVFLPETFNTLLAVDGA